jgi:hypothetical protein
MLLCFYDLVIVEFFVWPERAENEFNSLYTHTHTCTQISFIGLANNVVVYIKSGDVITKIFDGKVFREWIRKHVVETCYLNE